MFGEMLEQVKRDVASIISRVQFASQADLERMEAQQSTSDNVQAEHAEVQSAIANPNAPAEKQAIGPGPQGRPQADPVTPFVRTNRKVGRNEPCPCGSGKKYKQCHGKLS